MGTPQDDAGLSGSYLGVSRLCQRHVIGDPYDGPKWCVDAHFSAQLAKFSPQECKARYGSSLSPDCVPNSPLAANSVAARGAGGLMQPIYLA